MRDSKITLIIIIHEFHGDTSLKQNLRAAGNVTYKASNGTYICRCKGVKIIGPYEIYLKDFCKSTHAD